MLLPRIQGMLSYMHSRNGWYRLFLISIVSSHRRFTPRECARIMGFSNTFSLGKFICKKKEDTTESFDDEAISTFNSYIKENYYMLGNAVCPPVIAAISGSILACVFQEMNDTSKGNNRDWSSFGLFKGIELSISSLSPNGKSYLLEYLRKNNN